MAEERRRVQTSAGYTLQPRRTGQSNGQHTTGQSPQAFRVVNLGNTFRNCTFGPSSSRLDVDNTYINCKFSHAKSGAVTCNVGNVYINCQWNTHASQNTVSSSGISYRMNSICSSFRAPSIIPSMLT